MAARKRKTPPPSSSPDWRDSEETIRMEVLASLRDSFFALAGSYVTNLRQVNQTTAELRRSLELNEHYREQMAQHILGLVSRLKEGGVTPDGKYRFDDENGWQRIYD